ncbi:hypothetical protein GCM10010994_43190 [Chelatococcus reniformis]|uniref:Uncharacterized protein n=1 Tax=Chelatococcus reniformis TaxID=1494448 RepID=A0A916UP98_9HYPH|nr:hypothetical protein GCM10010994_43190 [Chelatococcus reniformis]
MGDLEAGQAIAQIEVHQGDVGEMHSGERHGGGGIGGDPDGRVAEGFQQAFVFQGEKRLIFDDQDPQASDNAHCTIHSHDAATAARIGCYVGHHTNASRSSTVPLTVRKSR